ncbi:MAG: alpha/beta fold hydrolase [Dehalococcoidia bacterium]|nr:alpha/beta fold hydrolase [Dehalococcoidia bacterium]
MPKAIVNGNSIYYEAYGSGEPLLLIMGLGASTLAWHAQVPTLSRYLRVIAFDNRGSGRSDRPQDYSMPLFARDAAGLLRTLGIDSAHVFGVSMGGMIAQQLALDYPGAVRSLILGATSPCLAAWPPEQAVQDATARAMDAPPREGFEVMLWTGYSDRYVAEHKEDLWLQFQIELPLMPPVEFWQKQLAAVLEFDARERLKEISVPTLVIGGADDPVIPRAACEYLAEHIPGAELVLFPGARHGFNIEREEETNQAVLDFIRRSARASAASEETSDA